LMSQQDGGEDAFHLLRCRGGAVPSRAGGQRWDGAAGGCERARAACSASNSDPPLSLSGSRDGRLVIDFPSQASEAEA
jgi:hypothetical protein